MSVAKGIGGGFPMGACLATAEAAKGMTAGTHGTTFGGNPLAMAVGNAVLDVILEDGFLGNVRRVSGLLREGLESLRERHPAVIADIRGDGLLTGFRTHVPNTEFIAAARDEGLLVIGAGGNVVRLLPPLIIGETEVAEAVAQIEAACATITARRSAST
jgi:acetylornithine/N-succinyldiaminopimelate aminotransferase